MQLLEIKNCWFFFEEFMNWQFFNNQIREYIYLYI